MGDVARNSFIVLTVFQSIPPALPLSATFSLFFSEIDQCGVDGFVVEMRRSPGTNQNLD